MGDILSQPSADSSLCGGGEGLSSVMRVNAHDSSFCGRHQGDFASVEARRWTEPVWQLSNRPRHPFGPSLISLY